MENTNSTGTRNRIFAFITLIFGYCIIKFTMSDGLGLPATLTFLLLNFSFIAYQLINKFKITLDGIFLYTVNILLSISFSLYSFETIKVFTAMLLFFLIPCTAYFAFIRSSGKDPIFFFEIIKATFIHPFIKFGNLFKNIFTKRNGSKTVWKALLGLAISIPFATVIILILISADSAFESLFDYLFSDFFNKLFTELLNIIISLPISCAVFSMICASSENVTENILKEETCNRICNQVAFVPTITSAFFVIPICLVYVIYFISQTAYFLSGFNGILPGDFTYSEYARQGFYELCIVSFINLSIITAINIFGKKSYKKMPIGNILTLILSTMTIALIAIAMSKMLLYINEYGLTRLRIFVVWFLILLALLFIAIILKQFIKRVMLLKTCAVIVLTMMCILAHLNIDAKIAQYNIENHENGKLDELDIYMLSELSDDAIPYISNIDNPYINSALKDRATIMEDNNSHWNMNLQTHKAKELLVNSK